MEEDRMGMRIQSETVEITKDEKGLVGISIGGGHPYCPCVYVVQIFDKSPADADGRGYNITINKLETEPSKGKTLDIVMKKIKHKIVEFMDADSADALGLSRAILCNDPLLKKMKSDSLKNLRPLIADLVTYVDKVVPDTQLTLKKYLDVKYEYLSYCLKLKEMDDEELEYHSLNEGLYRVETGNYEYR
ncbi:unnamed protein product [Nippostrongylus brasiliensis]|uniref:PRKCA-binding protein (inferred by orthology to a human protein) n=1 Tax=Nippostrongylus brasiliensis TaxID=27835 RepID=A0A158QX49_NIPBR|nr:unnamed protein product [Nippostrongylus brasiliensis]